MPCPPLLSSEVVRMPPLARVPQAPRSLMGLANLRGSVLPVASVRALLGRQEAATTPASRLIVLDGASPVALAVDEVSNLVRVAPEKVKTAEADVASESGEHLQRRVRNQLSCHQNPGYSGIAPAGVCSQSPQTSGGRSRRRRETAKTSRGRGRPTRLVTFDVAGQEYALPLDVVREIVTAPESLTFVPGSDDAVRGVMPYRGRPVAACSRCAGFSACLRHVLSREKVLIVSVGDRPDRLCGGSYSRCPFRRSDRIESAPPVLAARAGGETQIKEIYRAENGRLVSILAPERLFREDVMQKLVHGETTMKAKSTKTVTTSKTDELKFLVFRLDDNEFALPIDAVDEVARVPDQITRLPKTPKFLEGVVNLRGEVLPVIDQRRRFEMQPATASGHRRLVVVRTERHRAGLIVDSVSEVLRCTPDLIKPSPGSDWGSAWLGALCHQSRGVGPDCTAARSL